MTTHLLTRPLLFSVVLLSLSRLPLADDKAQDLPPSSPSSALSTRVTSLTVDFPSATDSSNIKAKIKALLSAPITFTVKDASFLTSFDAALSAASKPCRIECRNVKNMRLSFGVRETEAGNVLDALAKAGNCKLYVLPTKLLICPPEFLNSDEKKVATAFSSLVTKNSLSTKVKLTLGDKASGLLDVSNTPISISVEDATLSRALDALFVSTLKPHRTEYRMPADRRLDGRVPTNFTFSFQGIAYGEAQDLIARMAGCEVYLLSDRYLISSPDMLTEDEKKVAILVTRHNRWEDPSLSRS